MEGVSNVTFPNCSNKLFSSGTQSKHHAKFSTLRSKLQYSFIHCPPHGPGSKKGTTRNGWVTACLYAFLKSSPFTIFG